MRMKETRTKSPMLYHSSASVLLMRKNYQHHLEQAYLALHGQDKPVNVRIRPESLNPMDPSAIAIDVDYGTGWTHIGYIASQLCEYLHPLIATGDILEVYIQHIKYRVDFFKIGFYQKIFIKRGGVSGRLKW